MRIPQLTLYDFLADFLPGAVALALLGGLLWLAGYPIPAPTTSMGVILVVTSYPVGRTIHAIAGQTEIKEIRERTFDNFAFALENARLDAELVDEDVAIGQKPSVVERLNSAYETRDEGTNTEASDGTTFNSWIDSEVVQAFTAFEEDNEEPRESDEEEPRRGRDNHRSTMDHPSQIAMAISSAEIDWGKKSFGQFQRFGFSELFDESTLYQRYNILETFYRNLWLVAAYFSTLFFIIGVFDTLAGVRDDYTGPTSLLTIIQAHPLDSVIWFTVLILIIIIGYANAQVTDNDEEDTTDGDEDTASIPYWYCLLALPTVLLIFVLPTILVVTSTQSTALDATHFSGIGLILLALAVVFDVRRLQFKDRQVRAFINDLYRHQHSPRKED